MQPTNRDLIDELLVLKARALFEEYERCTHERSVLLKALKDISRFVKEHKNDNRVYKYGLEIHACKEGSYIREMLLKRHEQERNLVRAELLRRGLCTARTMYTVIGVWEREN